MIKWPFLAFYLAWSAAFAAGTAGTEAETLTAAAAAGETQTCPRCRYENKPDAKFCVKCGAELGKEPPEEKRVAEKECPKCGGKNPAEAKFCTKCGYSLKPKKAEVGAALAPPPKKGVYFTGGLASYGVIELKAGGERAEDDMGPSWAVGGGFVLPVWSIPGVAQLSLELSTDGGFSTIDKEFEEGLEGLRFKIGLIPIRETAIFGVGVGPRNMIKPFCGFGAGVGILMWEFKHVDLEEPLDDGTSVKPFFNIPFGCEFRVTPSFALGVKADYLIIPGDIEMLWWENEWYELEVNASVPDVFLFGGTARLGF